MKILAVIAVVGLIAAAVPATAVQWTETFESYALGPLPVDPNSPWISETITGTYTGTPGTVVTRLRAGNESNKAWKPGMVGTPNQASRIRRPVGQAIGNGITVGAWFYGASNGGSKRSYVGVQNAFTVDKALLRIGTNNTANFLVHWYNGAGITVYDTLVPSNIGWYYLQIQTVKLANPGDWRCDWAITPEGGTTTTGSTPTITWLASAASNVVVGLNVGTTYEIDWDDVTMIVPEPGSLLALGTGLIGLVGILRRRS